jgi:hypothetical protein
VKRVLAVALAAGVLAGCGSSTEGSRASTRPLNVFPASFDLAVDRPARFLVGLSTVGNRFVSGGSVSLRFFFLGRERAEGDPELVSEATASFLPIPGEEDEAAPSAPRTVGGDAARGVYRVEELTFDRAGFWEVEAAAALGGGEVLRGRGAFQVLPEPQVPYPGEAAPRTENLTASSKGAPPEAVDSRAVTEGRIPDPELHATTIADAIRRGRPVLAVFATPVYCVSKFCGPVTDVVAELAAEYGDRAEFVHVEIWKDFQNQVVNEAAAEWLLRDGSLQEPWVFLIGGDGRVLARWDNVATRGEMEPLLRDLPPTG